MDLIQTNRTDHHPGPQTNKMSLIQNLVDILNISYDGEAWKEVETMMYVIGKTNWQKVLDRMYFAMDNPEVETKVVLFEYNYTTKQSQEYGIPNVTDRFGVNNILVHDAMYRDGFVKLMKDTFCLNNDVTWYRRRRINADGKTDPHRMQVVLLFKPYALVEYPDPPSPDLGPRPQPGFVPPDLELPATPVHVLNPEEEETPPSAQFALYGC